MEKEKNSKITREEALRRLETARKLKREYVAKLEKEMKEEFKKRTGQEATYFEVWYLERINSNSPYAVTALRDSMCFRFVTDFGVIYYASRVCAIAFLSFGFIPRRVNLISLSCLRTSEMQMGYRIMRRLLFDSIIPI